MAVQFNVSGATLVKFGVEAAEVDLGYTEDGAQITIQPQYSELFSDDWGGTGGAPADSQLLGARAFIRLRLTKYDIANVQALTSFDVGGAVGVLPQFGELVRQDTHYGNLILDGANADYTFAEAFVKEAFEINSGTRAQVCQMAFEAWLDDNTARTLFTYA